MSDGPSDARYEMEHGGLQMTPPKRLKKKRSRKIKALKCSGKKYCNCGLPGCWSGT